MNTEWQRMKELSVSVSELAFNTGISYESLSEIITYLALKKGMGYEMAFEKMLELLLNDDWILLSRKENSNDKYEKDI